MSMQSSLKDKRTPPARTVQQAVKQLARLFWDHPLTSKDLEAHPVWVVERVLEYGTLADVELLRDQMGRKAFLVATASAQRMSPRTANFWKHMLDMEGISCTKKFFRNTAWNS